MHEFQVSNPRSGVSVSFCPEAYEALVRISQRWAFAYHTAQRTIRMLPKRDGWVIGRAMEKTEARPYRVCSDWHPHEIDLFGPVQIELPRDTDYRPGVMLRLPDQLPPHRSVFRSGSSAPRAVPRSQLIHIATERPLMAEPSAPPGDTNVMVCLGGRDLVFQVPEHELMDHVLDWTARGLKREE